MENRGSGAVWDLGSFFTEFGGVEMSRFKQALRADAKLARDVDRRMAVLRSSRASCAAMPSAVTTTFLIPASRASNTASLANRGGTKSTEASAPDWATAARTVL